ncbi:MAG TPA: DUF3300 domain-containing protein [Acidobacteriota bacterium]|nr:DUF3300 domain-containing protein [Acidobacteriota bacterium]
MRRFSPFSLAILLVFIFLGAGTIAWVRGQEAPLPPEQQPPTQQAPQRVWSSEELDNLVAPIALFPDTLVSQMLVASTYPLEIVEASQWLEHNRNLRGQELVNAARQQPWDPSVQALVAVPDALAKLNQDIRWTTDLGNAFLAQQADVMNAIQRMRGRAQTNGRLTSTPQQTVTTEDQGGQQAIVIQPANPQVVYVPVYDPAYIWGPPVYGYYPPLYYPWFGFGFGPGFDLAFCFGGWGGWGAWGWGPSWFGHTIFINHSFFHHYGFRDYYASRYGFSRGFGGRTVWAHDARHRFGVPYANHQTAARFQGASMSLRNTPRSGAALRTPGASNGYRSLGRSGDQGYRYSGRQQYQPDSRQYRAGPQVRAYQSQPQGRYQAPQQYRGGPQVRAFQSQPQERYQAPQQYRPGPQVRAFQSQPQQRYQAPRQYQAAPQMYRAAPQAYRSAPRMSAPRFSGSGNYGRSGGFAGGGFSSRGGGGFSGGGFSSRGSGSGGGHSSGGNRGGGHRR